MSLCLHLEIISFRLFRDLTGSAREIRVFSIRQSWQFLVFLLYEGARDNMDQADEKGISLFFRSQMWEERAVQCALLLWEKEALCAVNLVLKDVEVKPMYSFTPSGQVTVFL